MDSDQSERFFQKLARLNNRREELRRWLSEVPSSIDHMTPEKQREYVFMTQIINERVQELKKEMINEIRKALFTGELVI